MNNVTINQKRLKISRISIISIIMLAVGIVVYLLNFPIAVSGFITKEKEPLLMIAPLTLWIASFTLGIIDIFKKERRKVLSIITVVISGLPLTLFLLFAVLLLVFGT